MIQTTSDFSIASSAARRFGLALKAPASPVIYALIPEDLSARAKHQGLRLEPAAGYGGARVRVHLPAGAGFIEARGSTTDGLVKDLRAVLDELAN